MLHLKKLSILLFLLLLPVWLAGCRDQKTVGLCFRQKEEGVTTQFQQSLHAALLKNDYRTINRNAANDQSRQNQQVGVLLEKCDLLVVEPVMTSAAGEILQKARSADIPVIFVNFLPETAILESWEKTCYIGSDMSQPGLLQSQLVQQLPEGGDINGDGTVAYTVISGPQDHVDAVRWTTDCIMEQNGKLLTQTYGDWSRDGARAICYRHLAQFGDEVEVIFCQHNMQVQGALEALESKDVHPGEDVYLVGIGGDRAALALIQEGRLTGTVAPDISGLTERIAKAAQILLSNGQPEKIQILDYQIITKENLEAY